MKSFQERNVLSYTVVGAGVLDVLYQKKAFLIYCRGSDYFTPSEQNYFFSHILSLEGRFFNYPWKFWFEKSSISLLLISLLIYCSGRSCFFTLMTKQYLSPHILSWGQSFYNVRFQKYFYYYIAMERHVLELYYQKISLIYCRGKDCFDRYSLKNIPSIYCRGNNQNNRLPFDFFQYSSCALSKYCRGKGRFRSLLIKKTFFL